VTKKFLAILKRIRKMMVKKKKRRYQLLLKGKK